MGNTAVEQKFTYNVTISSAFHWIYSFVLQYALGSLIDMLKGFEMDSKAPCTADDLHEAGMYTARFYLRLKFYKTTQNNDLLKYSA